MQESVQGVETKEGVSMYGGSRSQSKSHLRGIGKSVVACSKPEIHNSHNVSSILSTPVPLSGI